MPCFNHLYGCILQKPEYFCLIQFFPTLQTRGGNSNARADNINSVTFTIDCVRNLPILVCSKKMSPMTPFFLFLI